MSFTLINGQIYTPGLAIINAPQPYTPLGGDNLHISIDVSGNGRLSLTPEDDAPTQFHDLRIFLTSNEKERNLTISNGTVPGSNSNSDSDSEEGYIGPILTLEPSSTVKHVNWIWPDCFVGEGDGNESNNDRDSGGGDWNISFHQAFRWEGEEYYTVFSLPISVSNGVEEGEGRVDCGVLENEFGVAAVQRSNASLAESPWVGEGEGDDSYGVPGPTDVPVPT
ncbi:hypothetical protein BDV12DRAFT_206681 [Aspergillus spectabilis]